MLLIIDGSNLCWRAHHVLSPELSHQGMPTGLIYGSLKMVNSLYKKFNPSNIFICWDSPKSIRKQIHPEYKANRRKDLTPAEKISYKHFLAQLIELKMLCKDVGIASCELEGFEADDIMALAANKARGNMLLVTTDNDLYQLLTPYISIYNFKKIYKAEDFEKDFGIEPSDWVKVKVLAGCDGDNVKGFTGIGIKRAIKIIKGERKYPEDPEGIMSRNLRLVKLPLFDVDIEVAQTEVNREVLFDYLCKHSISSIGADEFLRGLAF